MAGERRKHCASLSIHSRTGTSKAGASGTDRGQANVNEPEVHCCATVVVRKTDSGTKLTFYPNHSGHSPTSDPFSVLPKSDMCTEFVRAKLLAGLSVKDVLREWRKLLRDPAVRSCGVFAPWDGGLSDMDVRNILASMVPQRKCVLHTVVALCDAQLHAAVTRASLLLGLQAGCLRHRADSHKVEQLWQQYPRGTCPIRYFKPAQACTGADGELGRDFCIVFQVRFQHGDTLMHEVALLMCCV